MPRLNVLDLQVRAFLLIARTHVCCAMPTMITGRLLNAASCWPLQIQIRRMPKPVIAMVAGYAVGGGHILHMVCDLTIAADNAVFGQTGPKAREQQPSHAS